MTVSNSTPSVCFRLDASNTIGGGHLRRCLVLAQALKPYFLNIQFACQNLPGSLYHLVEESGFELMLFNAQNFEQDFLAFLSSEQFGLLIVDNYAANFDVLQSWQHQVQKLLVIDDLANRKLACDFLLDPGLGKTSLDYQDYVNAGCVMWMGMQFAIINPSFTDLRPQAVEKRKSMSVVKEVLITLGSSDVLNLLPEIITKIGIESSLEQLHFKVIVSHITANLTTIREVVAASHQVELVLDTQDMASEMLQADYAITAAGVTTYERSCLGLPGIVVPIVDNQLHFAGELAQKGWFKVIHPSENLVDELIAECKKLGEPDVMKRLCEDAESMMESIDGLGAQRVAKGLAKELMDD